MTRCHHYQITHKSQAHSRVPQCDGLPSILFNKQNGYCISRCSNSSVKWFIPHVGPFATHLNHKVSFYVSSVPDQHAWDIDALNIISSGLPAYAYPPTGLLHRVIQNQATQLPHCNRPRLARMPWCWDLVQLLREIPLHLPVSKTLLKQSHNQVFQRNSQHFNLHAWYLGVDSSKTSMWKWKRELVPLKGYQQGPSTSQKWVLFEKWCREISVDFSSPSVKQVSDFLMYLYQNQNRCPSTTDGYRTAFVDTLIPAGFHISQISIFLRLFFV